MWAASDLRDRQRDVLGSELAVRRLGATARHSLRVDLSLNPGTEGYAGGEEGGGDGGNVEGGGSNNRCGGVDHVWESVYILKRPLGLLKRPLGHSTCDVLLGAPF